LQEHWNFWFYIKKGGIGGLGFSVYGEYLTMANVVSASGQYG
jgi:hypothetical protein